MCERILYPPPNRRPKHARPLSSLESDRRGGCFPSEPRRHDEKTGLRAFFPFVVALLVVLVALSTSACSDDTTTNPTSTRESATSGATPTVANIAAPTTAPVFTSVPPTSTAMPTSTSGRSAASTLTPIRTATPAVEPTPAPATPSPEPTATPTPTPDNVFEAGETLPNSPAEFSDWRRFGGGAQAQSGSGGFVILMDNGGYGWTYDAVYTCIDPAGCRIVNGRVTGGAVRRTEPTATPTPATPTPVATDTPSPEPTATLTPELAPVVLGICRDGMTLQPGEGCSYTGGGTPRASVVLSVTHDGAICREGGPAKQVVGGITLNVDNLRLCYSDGFEVDDAFQSEIVATANAEGSWTFYESRQSAQRSLRPTPEPTATPTPTPDNVFEAGETLPNSPAEFSDWRRFGGGAQAQSGSGGFVILMDNGGYGWTYDAVYTCIDPAGCRIVNGRVTGGAVRRTEPTATPTPATPTPVATDTPSPEPTATLTPEPTAAPATPAPATRLTNDDAADWAPDWSPDGQRIAFESDRDGDLEIYVMNADGSGVTRLTDHDAPDALAAWSPDGQRIAFMSARDGDFDIYVMNADGSGVTRLTNDADDWWPAWSPDGQRIAFESERDGDGEIYVMNADGSGVTRLTNNDAGDGVPAWSPDGQRIAFMSDRDDGDYEIYVMNADGSGVTRLTNNDAGDGVPAWSPDGQRIAFSSDRDGNDEIYVMNADGSGVTRLTDNDTSDWSPDWSPDGQRIAFRSDRDGDDEIYVMNAAGEPVATTRPTPVQEPVSITEFNRASLSTRLSMFEEGRIAKCQVGLVLPRDGFCIDPDAESIRPPNTVRFLAAHLSDGSGLVMGEAWVFGRSPGTITLIGTNVEFGWISGSVYQSRSEVDLGSITAEKQGVDWVITHLD